MPTRGVLFDLDGTLLDTAGELERRADAALLERAVALFSRAYDEESGRHCLVFPGVAQALDALAADRLLLACVTNKAQRFTVPLLERMGLATRFGAVVCGDMVDLRALPRSAFLVAGAGP